MSKVQNSKRFDPISLAGFGGSLMFMTGATTLVVSFQCRRALAMTFGSFGSSAALLLREGFHVKHPEIQTVYPHISCRVGWQSNVHDGSNHSSSLIPTSPSPGNDIQLIRIKCSIIILPLCVRASHSTLRMEGNISYLQWLYIKHSCCCICIQT